MEEADVRAKILQELYTRKRGGQELLTSPMQYAKLLGISEEVANFNIQYLISKGLVDGQVIPVTGTTKKFVSVNDIGSAGIEAVEGHHREDYAVNFNSITFNAPVSDSQIAGGDVGSQNQRKVDARGSKGTTVQSGERKGVDLAPYADEDAGHIRLGRIFMRLFFKRFDHSLTPFALIGCVLLAAFVAPLGITYYEGSSLGLLGSAAGALYSFVVLVLGAIFLITWSVGKETTCPSCGSHFTWMKTRRTLTGKTKTPDGVTTLNLRESFKCSNCGMTREDVPKIETFQPPDA